MRPELAPRLPASSLMFLFAACIVATMLIGAPPIVSVGHGLNTPAPAPIAALFVAAAAFVSALGAMRVRAAPDVLAPMAAIGFAALGLSAWLAGDAFAAASAALGAAASLHVATRRALSALAVLSVILCLRGGEVSPALPLTVFSPLIVAAGAGERVAIAPALSGAAGAARAGALALSVHAGVMGVAADAVARGAVREIAVGGRADPMLAAVTYLPWAAAVVAFGVGLALTRRLAARDGDTQ